jgi:tRNA dimethylallyltransferase
MHQKPLLVCIVGPTAVGKTSVAIELATQFKTEIISADSRQFYREMKIGTAKPSDPELSQVKHHFINSLSIHNPYDVKDFEREALSVLELLFASHQVVVVSGGSGLFIKALVDGIDDMPDIPGVIREGLESDLALHGLDYLTQELKEKDQFYYDQVDVHNPRRVLRALEHIRFTGEPFSKVRIGKKVERPFRSLIIVLDRDRAELYHRINIRVDQMIADGLVEECRSLIDFAGLNALNTVGYSETFEYLNGQISLQDAVELIKRNTRRYAKRQLTWWRKEESAIWFHPDNITGMKNLITSNL